uniref:Protein TOPLESS isoform X2 n=1 Tax=Rhizophora mucronata TaxID=61149 RepID=A0A2P2JL82_RHIMU
MMLVLFSFGPQNALTLLLISLSAFKSRMPEALAKLAQYLTFLLEVEKNNSRERTIHKDTAVMALSNENI